MIGESTSTSPGRRPADSPALLSIPTEVLSNPLRASSGVRQQQQHQIYYADELYVGQCDSFVGNGACVESVGMEEGYLPVQEDKFHGEIYLTRFVSAVLIKPLTYYHHTWVALPFVPRLFSQPWGPLNNDCIGHENAFLFELLHRFSFSVRSHVLHCSNPVKYKSLVVFGMILIPSNTLTKKVERSGDRKIQRFKDLVIERSRDPKIERLKDREIEGSRDRRIQRSKDPEIERFRDSKI
ncbi:hypothetical protein WH47_02226 [Habropoda laboriosa]|uniref:Uncharacterized protein n=1 Tax=Habropoda laboriosa TaxID=597456 RepID=A0A0L7QZ60_9HYME|nr:hypothetical protein WH47_02226 [Habropoda laboriosa]